MQKSDFYFDLPLELIAQYPTKERRDSRLMAIDRQTATIQHQQFSDFPSYLRAGDLLVFNNTKVIPARLFGEKLTGGKVEVMLERLVGEHRVLAQVRASKSPKVGSQLLLENCLQAEVLNRHDDLFELKFDPQQSALDWLQQVGHIPLPPYIKREDTREDQERYQTVYATHHGAVAAPTAGLHFDHAMLNELTEQGIEQAFVTLHVGAGTFQPIRVDNITNHKMHSEVIDVSENVCEQIRHTKAKGGRVIAVGTTSVRCLESASRNGDIQSYQGETEIFIYPGYSFQCVDALLTNFHLPESSLIMLVAAFAGYPLTMDAYRQAIIERYRFFSYGDAMFIFK